MYGVYTVLWLAPDPKKQKFCATGYDFFMLILGFVEIALQHQCLLSKWFQSLRVTFNCLLKLFFGAQFAHIFQMHDGTFFFFFFFFRYIALLTVARIANNIYVTEQQSNKVISKIWYLYIVLIMNTVRRIKNTPILIYHWIIIESNGNNSYFRVYICFME